MKKDKKNEKLAFTLIEMKELERIEGGYIPVIKRGSFPPVIIKIRRWVS